MHVGTCSVEIILPWQFYSSDNFNPTEGGPFEFLNGHVYTCSSVPGFSCIYVCMYVLCRVYRLLPAFIGYIIAHQKVREEHGNKMVILKINACMYIDMFWHTGCMNNSFK